MFPYLLRMTLWIPFEGSDHNTLILTSIAKTSLPENAMRKQSRRLNICYLWSEPCLAFVLEQVAVNFFQKDKEEIDTAFRLQTKDRFSGLYRLNDV